MGCGCVLPYLRDFPDIPGALLEATPSAGAMVTIQDETGSLTNGKLRADIWPDGTLHFFNIATRPRCCWKNRADLQ